MGYFALPTEKTIEGYLRAVIANIELYLEDEGDYRYLLDQFALGNLERAIDELEKNSGHQKVDGG